MKIFLSILSVMFFTVHGYTQNKNNDLPASNPFKYPSTLPYQVPAFDKIKDADYLPAMEEGIREELAEIQKIANNPAPPTFQNTMIAMEKTGSLLRRSSSAFGSVSSANTNPALQKIRQEISPK